MRRGPFGPRRSRAILAAMEVGDNSPDGLAPRLPSLRFGREPVLRSRAAQGDAAAFARIYERHHEALYRYCQSLLRDDQDAQDALQSTMESAFAALQRERPQGELRPWLFRIAHQEALAIREARRELVTTPDSSSEPGADERFADREALRDLRDDVAELPDRQRAVIVLHELNGLSKLEIAEILGCSRAAVQQALADARVTLTKCREGRAMECESIRRTLVGGDRRALKAWHVRAHLRSCPACREFRAQVES